MKIGTKSLLYGAHQFLLHPLFVAWGWWKLYGTRRVRYAPWPDAGNWLELEYNLTTSIWDPRLWCAFFVHDWGYWGSPNMDGPQGELHPYLGAHLMGAFFKAEWVWFTQMHSRSVAKMLGKSESPLCFADKMAIALVPWWLYVPMTRATGEIVEYQHAPKHIEQLGVSVLDGPRPFDTDKKWFLVAREYSREWATAQVANRRGEYVPDDRKAVAGTD